jgi:hypothetical protein
VRPTIPLSDWRLAVDLDATESVRRQAGHPADGCGCDQCARWKVASECAFPAATRGQLSRHGVDLQRPTDLYVTDESKEAIGFRVMYHIAGKVISGPAVWHESGQEDVGTMHHYKVVRTTPYVGLRVTTRRIPVSFPPAHLPALPVTSCAWTSDLVSLATVAGSKMVGLGRVRPNQSFKPTPSARLHSGARRA